MGIGWSNQPKEIPNWRSWSQARRRLWIAERHGRAVGRIAGIVSERDVIRSLQERGAEVLRAPVADIMSGAVLTCMPEDRVDDLAAMMTDHRVRHIPVLAEGRLAGIVSIGDVVKNRLEELGAERQQLEAYITQGG